MIKLVYAINGLVQETRQGQMNKTNELAAVFSNY